MVIGIIGGTITFYEIIHRCCYPSTPNVSVVANHVTRTEGHIQTRVTAVVIIPVVRLTATAGDSAALLLSEMKGVKETLSSLSSNTRCSDVPNFFAIVVTRDS